MASLNKIALILVLAMVQAAGGHAQRLTGGAGMVNAGFISTRYKDNSLQEYLPDSIRFGRGYTLIGAEGYYRNGKAIVSISGYLGIQGYQLSGEKMFERSLWTTHVGFGWILNRNANFSIYPSVSFGATGISLTEYRQHPSKEIQISQIVIPSAGFSFHFDYLILQSAVDRDAISGIVLGLKTGYRVGSSAPSQFQGWYATIAVGGLAFMNKKH